MGLIIYEDDYFFAIDKRPGDFVHPPELSAYPVPREKICLHVLREKLKRDVFPVHRLDAPTSGLVLFTYHREATRRMSRLFADREVNKTYLSVARGHTDDEGLIRIPLEIKGFKDPIDAETFYRTRARIELPFAVGKRYATSRYSLVEVRPRTGRWHQIRRHFDRIAHPLLGDIEHGDSHHNRFFRDHLGVSGLCLRATRLSFRHPWTGEEINIDAPETESWIRIKAIFSM
jgi:tRNA pseudouridine65 synthase